MNKNILFHCTTAYTAFNAVVISRLFYQNDNVYLMIPNCRDVYGFYNVFEQNNTFFKEIIILDEKDAADEQIKNNIHKILDMYSIDTYHIFTLNALTVMFLNEINDNVRVVLTEEGSMTYQPVEHTKQSIANERLKFIDDNQLVRIFDRVDEVDLYEPEMFDGSLDVPVRKMDISEILNSESADSFINDLNKFFAYTPDNNISRYIYFDVYFSEGNFIDVDFEKKFLEYLLGVFDGKDFQVKLHPRESKEFGKYRYGYKNINIQNSYSIPWELIFINMLIRNENTDMILMSIDSTAIFNSLLLSRNMNVNVFAISFIEIFKQSFFDKGVYDKKHNNALRFESILGCDRYARVETLREFENILKSIGFGEISRNAIKPTENERYYKLIQNTVAKTKISINGKTAGSFYNFLDEIIHIHFEFEQGVVVQEKNSFFIVLSENTLYTQIRDLKISVDNETADYIINSPETTESTKIKISDNQMNGVIMADTKGLVKTIDIEFEIEDLYTFGKMMKATQNGYRAQKYYNFMCKWMTEELGGNYIYNKLHDMDITSVAIYGDGSIGKILAGKIKGHFNNICFLISNGSECHNDIAVYPVRVVNDLPFKPDIIIVTPLYEKDIIISELKNKIQFDCRIVSIDELVK